MMCFVAMILVAFIALIVGIVIGYLGSQREVQELRTTLRDLRIDLANIKLGYTDGDKEI